MMGENMWALITLAICLGIGELFWRYKSRRLFR